MISCYEYRLKIMSMNYLHYYVKYIALANKNNIEEIRFNTSELELIETLKQVAIEALDLNQKHLLKYDIQMKFQSINGALVDYSKSEENSLNEYLDINQDPAYYKYESSNSKENSKKSMVLTITRLLGFIHDIYGQYAYEFSDTLIENFDGALLNTDAIKTFDDDEIKQKCMINQKKIVSLGNKKTYSILFRYFLVLMYDTILGGATILKTLYTSIMYSKWHISSLNNTFILLFSRINKLTYAKTIYRNQDINENEMNQIKKIYKIIQLKYEQFYSIQANIKYFYMEKYIQDVYNVYSCKNNIFLKLLLKHSYLSYPDFYQMVKKSDIIKVLKYVDDYYRNGENQSNSVSKLSERRYTLGVFIALFLLYGQALRRSSLENIKLSDFILTVIGTADEDINEMYFQQASIISNQDINNYIPGDGIIKKAVKTCGSGLIMINKYKNDASTFSPQVTINETLKWFFIFYVKYVRKYLITHTDSNKTAEVFKNNNCLFPKLWFKSTDTDFNQSCNASKIFSFYIKKKFNIDNYNINCFRRQQESYGTFIIEDDKIRETIIKSFNHNIKISSYFYNLYNKVLQSIEYQKSNSRLLGDANLLNDNDFKNVQNQIIRSNLPYMPADLYNQENPDITFYNSLTKTKIKKTLEEFVMLYDDDANITSNDDNDDDDNDDDEIQKKKRIKL